MKYLVTGGAGFIGSAVIRYILRDTSHRVLNVDKLTYAGNLSTLEAVADNPRYQFSQTDICDKDAIAAILQDYRPDIVLHFAAESHVDRSIDGPAAFISTNIVGTFNLLETCRQYYETLGRDAQQRFRFQHISTDEVYGSLGPEGLFTEDTPYAPNSPYSASKASSDHLVRAWQKTYGFPAIITNCSNNYGPYQFPEKLIPLIILNALAGLALPIYGKGENIRDWLHVEDHARALVLVSEEADIGQSYNIGGDGQFTNLEVVELICQMLDAKNPGGTPHNKLIEFVADRPGHDARYAIDSSKIKTDLGWTPSYHFEAGLAQTIDWFTENQKWWQPIRDAKYDGRRLGAGR